MSALPAYVGRYKLCREIGRGSFATVALAWDEELDSSVVLKILNAPNESVEERFLNEARLLRKIRAPNVVTVHDIGRLNDARPYFVLDYADRGTLADRLPHPVHLLNLSTGTGTSESSSANNLAELQALLLLVDALADGLSAIHAVGLVHRDIKPANIFFESVRRTTKKTNEPDNQKNSPIILSDERALVGDLGIAKDLNQGNDQPTMLGGTPLFLAPEQLDPTANIASSADIYAASAVLWTVLTGSPPPMPDRLHAALSDMPASWQSILSIGLDRDPAKRFQSMDEWRWAIHDIVGNAGRTMLIESSDRDSFADECPYKGLAAYQAEDAEKFCGREAMIDELLRRLQLHNVLVVGGPSGSGKSSLVRAGLIPALSSGSLPGSEHWDIHLLTPGNDPVARLQAVSPSTEHTQSHSLYVIDQFEELFTLADAEGRTEFLDRLAKLADQAEEHCKIVIVVRADFYADCAREAWLANRISNNQVLVAPMSSNELRQAIAEPARRSGYFLERGLIEAILEQAGEEVGALPLIAHSLVETWVRRDGNTLTLAGFQAAGGVVGAISQTADAAFVHQLDDAGREQTRRLMLRLVAAGNGTTPDTRRVLMRSELDNIDKDQAIDSAIIKILTDARLLSIDDVTIQIAHEALLHRWPRLNNWIEESRDDLRVRQKISRSTQDWQADNYDDDLLYRGTPLLAATEWLSKNPGLLNPEEQTFLNTSLQKSDAKKAAELERSQRSRRLRNIVLATLTLLTIGACLSSVIAYTAYRDSKRNEALADVATKAAESRFASALGAAAYGHVEEDPRLALVLAAESMAISAPAAAHFDTRAAMVTARHTLERGGPFLFGSPLVASNALAIALNPQGSILAVGSIDGSMEFLDTANRSVIQAPVKDHEGGIRDIEFSPDGRYLVTASTDGTLRLWQTNSLGKWVSLLLAISSDVIVDVDFMPDGESVISANDAGTVQQYFIDGRDQPPPIAVSDFGFNCVAISKDGKYVITGNADKSISGYSIATGERILGPIKITPSNHFVEFSFSADGKRFAAVDTDGFAHVLDFPSGEVSDAQYDFSGRLGILFFHPDGQRLFGGDGTGRLKEWSADSGELRMSSAPGHSQILLASSLSSDGRMLVTLGRDQIIRFWTLDEKFPLAQQWSSPQGAARGVSFSHDGKLLATADKQGLVQVRRIGMDDRPINLRGHMAGVWALAFSNNNEVLASADRSGRVRLWNATNGNLLQETIIGDEPIWSLAFTDDDQSLLAGSSTGVRRFSVVEKQWLSDPVIKTEGQLTRMDISGDQKSLAVSDSIGNIKLLDLNTSELLLDLKGDNDTIWSVALSLDGKTLAAASGGEIVTMYAASTGEQIARFTGHSGGATNVGFLADGATLVVTDRKGRIHWWDIQSARRLALPLVAHKRSIWRMQVHPDGTQVVTTGDDGFIRMWNVLDARRACAIGLPGFDATRRDQYLGSERAFLACSG